MINVRINTNLRPDEGGFTGKLRARNGRISRKIEKLIVDVYRGESPVKTGKFKNSIKRLSLTKRESSTGFESRIEVGPTAPHARFVVNKTSSSEGAYVPALNARIKFGRHPGTKENNVGLRTTLIVLNKADAIIRNEYRNDDVGRSI